MRGQVAPALFGHRNYRLHWIATAVSCLGDYFTLIAMPWLVLALSHDARVLGVVMALESTPRAVFMLVSGRFSDRHTPLRVLLVSRALFMAGLLSLALLLLSGQLQVTHLYAFALLFGVLSAFSMPAANALLPRLVPGELIQKGNSALMGMRQLVQLFAPILAGLLIWGAPVVGQQAAGAGDLPRIGWAFLFNAVAICASLLVLLNIRLSPLGADGAHAVAGARLAEGFAYLWRDRGLRIVTAYVACIGFFAIGPLLTALPQFAATRLDKGALSYGLLYAANGLGALCGFAAGGMLRRPSARAVGVVMLGADLVAGLCILWLGASDSFALAAPALALMGAANAYGGVVALSWIQQRIPAALSGRVLGVVMFAMMGLTPVSMALGGFVVAGASLATLLWLSGGAVAALSLLGLLVPAINRYGTYPAPAPAGAG